MNIAAAVAFTTVGLSPAEGQTGDFASLTASADAARQQGDVPKAIQLYKQAVEINPKWPDGWWFLGILQYDTNQYPAAQDALTQYIQLTPNAGPALALRGLCEFEMAQYPASLEDLKRGVSLGAANQPRNARIILYHEALVLTRLGDFEAALGEFTLLAKQRPDNQDLMAGLGLAGLRMNLLPSDVQPDQTALLTSVGEAGLLFMSGDLVRAEQAFQDLFLRYPKLPNVHYLYGYLLFPTKPDQAVDQFQQELAVSPYNASAHAMRAWALGMQGDYAEALGDGAKAVEEDPSLAMGQLAYGRALVETGDASGGLPHLESALRAEPGNLEAHLTLTKAYSELGRSEDARRERLLCLAMSDPAAGQISNQAVKQGAAAVATP